MRMNVRDIVGDLVVEGRARVLSRARLVVVEGHGTQGQLEVNAILFVVRLAQWDEPVQLVAAEHLAKVFRATQIEATVVVLKVLETRRLIRLDGRLVLQQQIDVVREQEDDAQRENQAKHNQEKDMKFSRKSVLLPEAHELWQRC